MKINKYRPFAYIYFFINSTWLPYGLLFTGILSPLFYVWLLLNQKKYVIVRFLLFLAPFAVIHLINGVVLKYYALSTVLLLSCYIYTYALKTYLEKKQGLNALFDRLTLINFALTLIALAYFNTPYLRTFWSISNISDKMDGYRRLAMFTYEPSYYSTLLVPLVLYYVASLVHSPRKKYLYLLLTLLLSVGLAFSLGIWICLALSVFFFFLFKLRHYILKKNFLRITGTMASVALLGALFAFIFFPKNPLFLRIENFIEGRDASGKGRTYEAFLLSYKIAELKSLAFGVGQGQIKVVGDPVIRNHYNYTREDVPIVYIPCAAAETIAIFGFLGFGLRFFLLFYFFYKTRTYDSTFRSMLFIYMFIYQFTGSYVTNVAEYTIWVLAFVPCFDQFERKKLPASPSTVS
ncbi:hypothetical protein [Rufibacter psychrotolerans]|uniref:hypothetical protein n=1 Tax=Rufibacter psychrotolerans TaxID=2812556 RepID=UPI001967BFC2|nr:hypothetical protein [Rufibacter sp. SYSU D00308]